MNRQGSLEKSKWQHLHLRRRKAFKIFNPFFRITGGCEYFITKSTRTSDGFEITVSWRRCPVWLACQIKRFTKKLFFDFPRIRITLLAVDSETATKAINPVTCKADQTFSATKYPLSWCNQIPWFFALIHIKYKVDACSNKYIMIVR